MLYETRQMDFSHCRDFWFAVHRSSRFCGEGDGSRTAGVLLWFCSSEYLLAGSLFVHCFGSGSVSPDNDSRVFGKGERHDRSHVAAFAGTSLRSMDCDRNGRWGLCRPLPDRVSGDPRNFLEEGGLTIVTNCQLLRIRVEKLCRCMGLIIRL